MTLSLHSSITFHDMDLPQRRLVVAKVRPDDERTSWFLTVFDGHDPLAQFSLSFEDGEKLCEALESPASHNRCCIRCSTAPAPLEVSWPDRKCAAYFCSTGCIQNWTKLEDEVQKWNRGIFIGAEATK